MEIKTIEELACIPVENDDFAAASDQDEGDVILRPSLNYWQDAWRRLRKNPVAILAIVMLAALAVIVGRSLNVAQTESYIERLLAQAQVTPPQSRPTYIIKDVRLFLNSIDRSLQMIRQCGVDADLGRRDTDSEILLTIRIPKQRAVRPS